MTTVAELTNTRPHAAAVLRRHHIDFCCGGQRPLAEACAAAGVTVPALLAEVDAYEAARPPATRWDQADTSALIDHLLTRYHATLREDLPEVEALARKVARVHGDHAPQLVTLDARVQALAEALRAHLDDEERDLFPALRAGRPTPVDALAADHLLVGTTLVELAALTDQYTIPDGACGSWTRLYQALEHLDADLRAHVALENNVLFARLGPAS